MIARYWRAKTVKNEVENDSDKQLQTECDTYITPIERVAHEKISIVGVLAIGESVECFVKKPEIRQAAFH